MNAHEDILAFSLDGGHTYEQAKTPPIPPGAPQGVTQWDGTLAVGPDGRLYYYAFLARPTGAILPAPPVGLQVAASTTAARSWETNVFLSALDGPSEPVVSPWKSWLGFGQGSTVYLDYNSRGSGLWVARSDDAGKTWGGFTRVQPADDRIISVFMGPPVVDSKGRLYIPYFGDQSPNYPNPFLPQGHQLRVASSDDRGATFRQRTIASKAVPDYVGAFFPILAIDGSDRLVLAYWDSQSRIQVRASFDRGETWQGPVQWSGEKQTSAAPWITVDEGRVTLMYYETGGMGYARGNVSESLLQEPAERGVLPSSAGGGGDFIHFALDGDGRMVVPVPNASERRVSVVFGPAWPT
ncbi:MAG TPA: sialidase family protein [Candidatus Thermoplasmatota archaeon]|nr:sialidase family protein [Candidatus Thermoplasmatota archaeon]